MSYASKIRLADEVFLPSDFSRSKWLRRPTFSCRNDSESPSGADPHRLWQILDGLDETQIEGNQARGFGFGHNERGDVQELVRLILDHNGLRDRRVGCRSIDRQTRQTNSNRLVTPDLQYGNVWLSASEVVRNVWIDVVRKSNQEDRNSHNRNPGGQQGPDKPLAETKGGRRSDQICRAFPNVAF